MRALIERVRGWIARVSGWVELVVRDAKAVLWDRRPEPVRLARLMFAITLCVAPLMVAAVVLDDAPLSSLVVVLLGVGASAYMVPLTKRIEKRRP